jgi:hypothetical protein
VKVDWPILVNLRLDPYERTGLPSSDSGSLAFYNWYAYEFWRFALVQQEVAKAAQSLTAGNLADVMWGFCVWRLTYPCPAARIMTRRNLLPCRHGQKRTATAAIQII